VPENAITAMRTASNISRGGGGGEQFLLTYLEQGKNHIPFSRQKKNYSWKNNNLV
jgi:hypothetical protein